MQEDQTQDVRGVQVRNSLLFLNSTLLCLAAGSAFAQDDDITKPFFVGVEYGNTEHQYSHEGYRGTLNGDDKLGAFYLGYRCNEFLSVKFGYVDQGDTEIDSYDDVLSVDNLTIYTHNRLKSDIDGTYFGLAFGGVSDSGFGIGFDVGIWRYTTDVYVEVDAYEPIYDQSVSLSEDIDEKTGVGYYLGISALYEFDDLVGAELGLRRYLAENDFVEGSDVKLANAYLGVKFRF